MSDNKRYYYLKLKETFFDLEEMKILESQKNGIEYQNLYLKLCLLSLKSEGALLFKGTIPYDMNMLSTVLRVNIDTIKTGIEMFKTLGLIDVLDSGIIYMLDIQTLIGQGSSEADRVRVYREKIKKLCGCTNSVQTYKNRTPELESEIESESESELDKEIKRKGFKKPTTDEISAYCKERENTIDPQQFFDYYESNGWKVGRNPMKDWKASVRYWERNQKGNKNGTARKSEPWKDPDYYKNNDV